VVGGATTLGTTTAATFRNTERGTLAISGGTPTLAESRIIGSQAFVASASETITFDIPQPDALYTVVSEQPGGGVVGVQNKLAASFDLAEVAGPATPITATVNYVVLRDI